MDGHVHVALPEARGTTCPRSLHAEGGASGKAPTNASRARRLHLQEGPDTGNFVRDGSGGDLRGTGFVGISVVLRKSASCIRCVKFQALV